MAWNLCLASLLGLAWLGPAVAQEPAPASPAAPAAPAEAPRSAPRVDVPTFGNATCPIMGKKVSMPLFVDTSLGRFYVCCKPCFRKILADLPTAHKTAYPVVQEWKNGKCPVSGEPIGEEAVSITLQGHRFSLCCAACAERARSHSQLTLIKLTAADTIDVGNTTCPLTGKPVAANALVRIDDHVVHLSSPTLVAEVDKAPAAVLGKAIEIAKAQPAAPPHVHQKRTKQDADPAPANDKD